MSQCQGNLFLIEISNFFLKKNSNLGNFLDILSVPPSSPRKTPFARDLFDRPLAPGSRG